VEWDECTVISDMWGSWMWSEMSVRLSLTCGEVECGVGSVYGYLWHVGKLNVESLIDWCSSNCLDSYFRGCSADHATPSVFQSLALTSTTSGSRSVGIVRSRTKGHGVCFVVCGFRSHPRHQLTNLLSLTSIQANAKIVLHSRQWLQTFTFHFFIC
jgi:hypothetical protein